MRAFLTMVAGPIALCAFSLAGCHEGPAPLQVPGGDVKLGKRLVQQYQCGSCHAIPGVAAASGTAGPPLLGFGRRSYIAGRIPNQAENLVKWLMNPPAMKPGTVMPNMGVSEDDARHMAAYLYSIQ